MKCYVMGDNIVRIL